MRADYYKQKAESEKGKKIRWLVAFVALYSGL